MRYLSVAFKNIGREKKRSFLLAGALAFGLTVIFLVGGLADGILSSFINQQSAMLSGHVVVTGYQLNNRDQLISLMEDNELLEEQAQEFFPDLVRVNQRTVKMGTLINGNESRSQLVVGMDAQQEAGLRDLLVLDQGEYLSDADQQGILLSKTIAEGLEVSPGDWVMVKVSTLQGIQNVADFRVSGIIADDLGVISELAAFAHRSYLNQVVNIPEGAATETHIFLESSQNSEAITTEFWQYLSDQGYPVLDRPEERSARYEVVSRLSSQDWEGVRYYLSSLEENFAFIYVIGGFLNGTSAVIMMMLIGIILVGITNTLRMMIFERRKEIGTYRALGMQKKGVVSLFILEMVLISLIGSVTGVVLSLVIGTIVKSIPLDLGHTFFSMFLYRGHLTLEFSALRFFTTCLFMTGLVALASWFPSRKSAKIDPAKAIHNIT